MAEYIEREAVIKFAESNKAVSQALADIVDIREMVNDVPSADVAPVVHAKWIPQYVSRLGLTDMFACSECNKTVKTIRKFIKCSNLYCPNCGAKMDGAAKK